MEQVEKRSVKMNVLHHFTCTAFRCAQLEGWGTLVGPWTPALLNQKLSVVTGIKIK